MAAEPAQDLSKDEVKRRAIRRLVAALVLLAIAVGGLAVLDHLAQKRRQDETPLPPAPPAPTEAPLQITPPEPPAEEPVEPEPEPEPPPPPEVDNAPVPGPLPAEPAPRDPEAGPATQRASGIARPPAMGAVPAPTTPRDSRGVSAPAEERWPPAGQSGPTPAGPPSAYLVQVGVFASPANAEALRDRLRRAGIDAHTETRVRIGPFKTAAEAQAVSARLRALGLEPVTLPQR
jgi:DedD protein